MIVGVVVGVSVVVGVGSGVVVGVSVVVGVGSGVVSSLYATIVLSEKSISENLKSIESTYWNSLLLLDEKSIASIYGLGIPLMNALITTSISSPCTIAAPFTL